MGVEKDHSGLTILAPESMCVWGSVTGETGRSIKQTIRQVPERKPAVTVRESEEKVEHV